VRLGSSDNGVLEDLVLLRKVDRLLPALVLLEEVGSNASELEQIVLLELLGQCNVVKLKNFYFHFLVFFFHFFF